MLASPQLQSDNEPPKGGHLNLEKNVDSCKSKESDLNSGFSAELVQQSTEEYVQLQQRIFRATFFVISIVVTITAFLFSFQFSINILVGALAGVIYLRLLARSIGQLGRESNSVSKIQLLVPVVLVLAVSKLPQLELLPVLLGFLLYKPAIIFQVFFDSRA